MAAADLGKEFDSEEDLGAAFDAEPDAGTPQAPTPADVGRGRSGILGFSQGGTLGFADEIGGLIGKALLPAPVHLGAGAQPAPDDTPAVRAAKLDALTSQSAQPTNYQLVRDRMRSEADQARQQHPGAYIPGEIAGAVALPMPGLSAAKGAGLAARVGTSALNGLATGAAYGLGGSSADLTKGDYGRALVDTTLGAGLGAAGGATGELLLSGARSIVNALRGRAQRGIQDAVEAEQAAQTALYDKSTASKQGELGSAVQSASRDLEVIAREAENLPPGPVKDQLMAYLASPEAVALREQVASSKLLSAPGRVGDVAAKRAELSAMQANRDANISLQTAEGLSNPLRKDILPRVMTLGARVMPLALGVAGHALGGLEGAAAGTGLGTVMSLTQGAPGRILKNMMQKPSVRKAVWGKVLSSLGGATPESYAIVRALDTAMDQGPQAFAEQARSLAQRIPLANDIMTRFADAASEHNDQGTAATQPSPMDKLQGALQSNSPALAPYAQKLAGAKDRTELAIRHKVLSETDPNYRQAVQSAMDDDEDDGQ